MVSKSALSQAVALDCENALLSVPSDKQYAVQYLQQEILSKYTTIEDRASLSAKTMEKFILANNLCLTNMDNFASINPIIVGEARAFLYRLLSRVSDGTTLSLGQILTLWRHGPGAIRDSKATHFVQKVSTRHCRYYPGMERLAILLLASTPRLARDSARFARCIVEVPGNEYFEVPKNDEENRVCAKEADVAMAYQLGTHALICMALSRVGIVIGSENLSSFGGKTLTERRNQFRAKLGSESGEIATVDLKQCSNLITPRLIRELWPSDWYHWLMLIRAPNIKIGADTHTLNMLSTMGCGYTFSVMTATLAALLYATQKVYGKGDVSDTIFFGKSFGVFGDDITCPSDLYPRLVEVLELCGLQVNPKKSFATGSFRESCGGHYYRGFDITPVYIKKLKTTPQKIAVLNGIVDYTARTGVFLPETFGQIWNSINDNLPFVPHWENPDAGFRYGGRLGTYWKYQPIMKPSIKAFKQREDLYIFLALGGYIGPAGRLRAQYTRRSNNVAYELTECSMPEGYTTGLDYMKVESSTRVLAEEAYLAYLF